jgi:CBS domain-containing protein
VVNLKEIMSRNVQCVPPDASLQRAASTMKTLDVGSLPVCDGDRLTGIVTDRDIVVRGIAAANGGVDGLTVRDVMTEHVIWAYEDDAVDGAAQRMQDRQIRRLPVLDREKRLVGIVSLGDLAVRNHDDKLSGQTLEQISEPVG